MSDPTVPTEQDAAATNGQTTNGQVEVECPGCGLLLVGDSPRPTAEWFCPQCDFPVFWASPPAADERPQKRARRRLPGTGGTEVVGAAPCWHCGEMNEPETPNCLRCAATLPKPVPPVPEPIRIEVPVPTPVPYVVPTATWPFVVAAGLAGVSLGLAATVLILRATGALVASMPGVMALVGGGAG